MAIGPDTTRAKAKVATREKILAAAREAFHHRGYDAVTIRGLAQDIGMSTGAVFASFADKETLFEEATGRKVPMNVIKDVLERIVHSDGAYVGLGDIASRQLLIDLYGSDA
jgi:AcrR family transcriptional regulator